MVSHRLDHRLGLDPVGTMPPHAAAAAGIDARHAAELQAVIGIKLQGRRRQDQTIAVELRIRHPDQRWVARPVVPFQHPLAQAPRLAQRQDAFHVGGSGADA